MYPFDSYPHGGTALLRKLVGGNCRHGYGLEFMQITGQTKCAYCGLDFMSSYENWLQMTLDHVVPKSVCLSFNLSPEWTEDCANKVLSCSACNGFCNRYKPTSGPLCLLESLDDFFSLRDKIFGERKELIQQKHLEEREFFNSKVSKKLPNIVLNPDERHRLASELGAFGETMANIESKFNNSFAHWEIRLPSDAVEQRKRGKIVKAGWAIWYLFGADEKGEYLDYYASHRMTEDQHVRIHADGRCKNLPTFCVCRESSKSPEEDARLEAEFFADNQKIAKMLEEKGFGLNGDEPGGVQINQYLLLNKVP